MFLTSFLTPETYTMIDHPQTLKVSLTSKQMQMYTKIARATQNLFPEVHSQRSYVSVEEEFKRRCSRTPMLLSQG
jgi:hypothetical protein